MRIFSDSYLQQTLQASVFEGIARTFAVKVNHLPPSVSKGELQKAFSSYGVIVNAEIKQGDSENYAFVNYAAEDEARRAAKARDGSTLHGGRITVKVQGETTVAQVQQHTVKVTNLSKKTDEGTLNDIFSFSDAVEIRSSKLVPCPIKPFNYAYVNYSRREDAIRAVQELNGRRLDDSLIKVNYQDPNKTSPSSPPAGVQPVPVSPPQRLPDWCTAPLSPPQRSVGLAIPHPQTMSLQPQTISPPRPQQAQTCAIKVLIHGKLSEDDLEQQFGRFGTITSKPKVRTGNPDYAYINFSTPAEANIAYCAKIGVMKGVQVQVKLSDKGVRPATSQECRHLSCDPLVGRTLYVEHEKQLKQFQDSQQVTIKISRDGNGINIWGDPSKLDPTVYFVNALLDQVRDGIHQLQFTLPCHFVPLFKDQWAIDQIASLERTHNVEFSVIDQSRRDQSAVVPVANFHNIVDGRFQSRPNSAKASGSRDKTPGHAVVKINCLSDYLTPTSTSPSKHQWFWEDDDGSYTPYPTSLCDEFNRQFAISATSSFECSIVTRLGTVTYKINFASMTQENAKTKNSRSIKYETASGNNPKWLYQDDQHQFAPYSKKDSDAIESMYVSKNPDTLIIHGRIYTFNFTTMKQINKETHYKRPIKRDIDPSIPATTVPELSLQVRGPQSALQPAIDELKDEIGAAIVTNPCSLQGANNPAFHSSLMQMASEYFVTPSIRDGQIELRGVQGYVEHVSTLIRLEVVTHQSKCTSSKEPTPSHWQPQTQKIELKSVSAGSDEWNKVVHLMQRTLSSVQVVKLERVQNLWLWDRYAFAKKRMSEKNGGVVNEKELFHGTRGTPPEKIFKSEQGFDFRFASRGMWGEGTYFAVNASYSNRYASQTMNSQKQMILAKVLTGETYCCEPQDLKKPPVKTHTVRSVGDASGFEDERYDSVSGNTNGSDIFIIYDFEKAYPAYLITYN